MQSTIFSNHLILRCVCGLMLLQTTSVFAQKTAETVALESVEILGVKTQNGIGHLLDVKEGVIYAGKKTEVLIVDSLDANKAINNTRQILGRIPGLNIVETETGGFTANGIATRGLNPTQSIEMNTRQNGYNISGDVYGYNEAYYLPPMEAVKRIEFVRGAAALQFGAQFGGLVNYVTEDAPVGKAFEFKTAQTMGNYGLFNTFNSIGGNVGKLKYYGFVQYRTMQGNRPNSEQWQLSGFGKIQYQVSERLKIGAEYSLLRNEIQMPGGLTDSLFRVSPDISTRSRNWVKSPWNVFSVNADFTPAKNTAISLKTTYLNSNRSLVWRNEDGGAAATDDIDPTTNAFVPREVGIIDLQHWTTELRASHQYFIGKQLATVAGGIRHATAAMRVKSDGVGTTNSDFDLTITGEWGKNLDYTTTNLAPFVENIFPIGSRLTLTPGFRFEYLDNTAKGYRIKSGNRLIANEQRSRTFALFGFGAAYQTSRNTTLYANISQAYRPIDYAFLQPIGVTSRIDQNMRDAQGFNTDLGWRGAVGNWFNFDISAFYLAYNDRIGTVLQTDPTTGKSYTLRTNVANSVHQGIESYVELDILKAANTFSHQSLRIFNSFGYTDAQYTTSEYKGKRVEAAAQTIERAGLTYVNTKLSATFQANFIGDAYGDASNTKAENNDDPTVGYIPAYTVLDFSATYRLANYTLKCGVNNLANAAYFTRRADEYPGPGIIPSVGRSFYAGFAAKF